MYLLLTLPFFVFTLIAGNIMTLFDDYDVLIYKMRHTFFLLAEQ